MGFGHVRYAVALGGILGCFMAVVEFSMFLPRLGAARAAAESILRRVLITLVETGSDISRSPVMWSAAPCDVNGREEAQEGASGLTAYLLPRGR